MRSLITCIALLILIVSCSGKGPTQAKFELNLQGFTAVNSTGGLVIFGTEAKGAKFARIVSNGTVKMEMPKGLWTIGAMAWDGTSGPMTGDIVCALNKDINIQTDSTTINLVLTNSMCFSSSFSHETGQGTVPNLTASLISANFCESDVSGLSTPCAYDPTAVTNPKRGFIGSYKILI